MRRIRTTRLKSTKPKINRLGTRVFIDRAYQYKLDWTIKRLDQMPITLSNTLSQENGWLRVISELPTDRKDLYTVTDNIRIVNTH